MGNNIRYNLLAKVEETRDYLIKLSQWNNFENDEISGEISKFREALEFIEHYAQQNKENESLDITNYKQAANELVRECKGLSEIYAFIYGNNAETMILDKALLTEKLYLENKNEDKFLLRIQKISKTCKQLDVGNLKKLSAYFDVQYLKNFQNTGEKLTDDYSRIFLDEKTKIKDEEIYNDYKRLEVKCGKFEQETKSVQQDEKDDKLLQLFNIANEQFKKVGTRDYNFDALNNLKKFAEQLVVQEINGDINLEDAQKQRDQLICEMEQLKENISNLKNEILINETIANVNKTKTQLAKMKEIGSEVEMMVVYSAFTNAHLDNLQNATEQMHYLNKEELLQEIINIKQENAEFEQKVKQQNNIN